MSNEQIKKTGYYFAWRPKGRQAWFPPHVVHIDMKSKTVSYSGVESEDSLSSFGGYFFEGPLEPKANPKEAQG